MKINDRIVKSRKKRLLSCVIVLLLVLSYFSGMPSNVYATTATPGTAFSYDYVTGGIIITGVDTTISGRNIVVPNKIDGNTVVGIYLSNKGLLHLM